MALNPADPFDPAVRKLARRWLRRVRRLAKGAARGDVEAVHHMRTGVRRLRTLLALAEGGGAKRLRKRARRFATALGAVRDLDVARERVRASLARGELSDDAAVAAWREALDRDREEALCRLRRSLRSGAFRAWRRRTKAWTRRGGSTTAVHEALPPVLAGLLRACEALCPPPDEPSLHELRKTIKRLRYALESFEDALPSETGGTVEALTRAQDALGEHRDRLVLAERADHEADAAATMGEDPRELRAFARRLRELGEGEVEAAPAALRSARRLITT